MEAALREETESARRGVEELDGELRSARELADQRLHHTLERDEQIELLQRRLSAQEAELGALRRAVGRSAATPDVQQIYERATAGLEAAKAELLKRGTSNRPQNAVAAAARFVPEPGPSSGPRRTTRLTGLPSALAPPLPAPMPASIAVPADSSPPPDAEDEMALEVDEDLVEAIEEIDPEPEPVLPRRR
jgi:hypothetical protein